MARWISSTTAATVTERAVGPPVAWSASSMMVGRNSLPCIWSRWALTSRISWKSASMIAAQLLLHPLELGPDGRLQPGERHRRDRRAHACRSAARRGTRSPRSMKRMSTASARS